MLQGFYGDHVCSPILIVCALLMLLNALRMCLNALLMLFNALLILLKTTSPLNQEANVLFSMFYQLCEYAVKS